MSQELDLNTLRRKFDNHETILPEEVSDLLDRLEKAERELVAIKSTQVQHIVRTSFETARTAGLALDEAVKIVSGWLVADPDLRARKAEAQVSMVRAMAQDWDVNGNAAPLGDPSADVWHATANAIRSTLDGESNE